MRFIIIATLMILLFSSYPKDSFIVNRMKVLDQCPFRCIQEGYPDAFVHDLNCFCKNQYEAIYFYTQREIEK